MKLSLDKDASQHGSGEGFNAIKIKEKYFLMQEVQRVRQHLDSGWMKWESRIAPRNNPLPLSSVEKILSFHDWKIREQQEGRWSTEDPLSSSHHLAQIFQPQPMILSPWISLYPILPPEDFPPLEALIPIMQITRERAPHAFISFSLCIRVSGSCISLLSEADALLEVAAAPSQLSHSLSGFQAQVRNESIIFLP